MNGRPIGILCEMWGFFESGKNYPQQIKLFLHGLEKLILVNKTQGSSRLEEKMTESQKEEKVSQRTRFHYVAAPFFIVMIIWGRPPTTSRRRAAAASGRWPPAARRMAYSAGCRVLLLLLLSLCIKKLLERIKVCIESIMMMWLPWDKKGGVQQNY